MRLTRLSAITMPMQSTSGSGRCQVQVRLAVLVAQVRGAVWSGTCASLIALRDKERRAPFLHCILVFHPDIILWRAVHALKSV